MSKFIDLTGHKYARVYVLSYYGHKGKRTAWNCLCDCGTKFVTTGDSLRTGKTSSCGCYRHEREIEANIKHGKHNTRIYNTYNGMKSRCYLSTHHKYKNYGGRGIKVCENWLGEHGFENFYEWSISNGYEDDLTIERIDVNGDYCPENCTWIHPKDQAKNKTNNIIIEYNGKKNILSEWCKILNLKYSLVLGRLHNGWDIEKALFLPKQKQGKYEYNGQWFTMEEISKMSGLKKTTIKSRIDRKWSMDRIINTPFIVQNYKNKKVI